MHVMAWLPTHLVHARHEWWIVSRESILSNLLMCFLVIWILVSVGHTGVCVMRLLVIDALELWMNTSMQSILRSVWDLARLMCLNVDKVFFANYAATFYDRLVEVGRLLMLRVENLRTAEWGHLLTLMNDWWNVLILSILNYRLCHWIPLALPIVPVTTAGKASELLLETVDRILLITSFLALISLDEKRSDVVLQGLQLFLKKLDFGLFLVTERLMLFIQLLNVYSLLLKSKMTSGSSLDTHRTLVWIWLVLVRHHLNGLVIFHEFWLSRCWCKPSKNLCLPDESAIYAPSWLKLSLPSLSSRLSDGSHKVVTCFKIRSWIDTLRHFNCVKMGDWWHSPDVLYRRGLYLELIGSQRTDLGLLFILCG